MQPTHMCPHTVATHKQCEHPAWPGAAPPVTFGDESEAEGEGTCTGAQQGTRSLRSVPCPGPKHIPQPPAQSARPAALLPVARAALGLANLGAGPPGPGPLCGRMAGRAGAQSKLNLHLGAPSGQSSRRSHRSPLMASSKCGAAASAPRVRAHPPSPRARCKMVFTKVNIGRGARWPPLPGPHQGCQGLLLGVPTAPGPEEEGASGQTQARHPRSPRAPAVAEAASAMGREKGRSGLGMPRADSWLRISL